jgi:pimeloyl-[acyl-carrier protein] methyl ester esterase
VVQPLPKPQTASTTPPVVLLHGWAMNAAAWGELPARLGRELKVLALELPGHGENDAPAPGSLDELAERLAPLVPAGAVVAGWSLGAQVALRLALRQERKIHALVLIGATPRFVAAEDWPHGMPVGHFNAFAAQLAADPATTIDRFVALAGLGSQKPKGLAAQLGDLLARRTRAKLPALTAGLEILRNADLRPEIAALRVPTWVIHGEGDAIVPAGAGRWLAKTIPGAQFVPLAAGHAPFLDHIDAITRIFRNAAFGPDWQP